MLTNSSCLSCRKSYQRIGACLICEACSEDEDKFYWDACDQMNNPSKVQTGWICYPCFNQLLDYYSGHPKNPEHSQTIFLKNPLAHPLVFASSLSSIFEEEVETEESFETPLRHYDFKRIKSR